MRNTDGREGALHTKHMVASSKHAIVLSTIICFAAKDTICAEMAFMYAERNAPGGSVDYPIGGTAALVEALVRGLKKHG